MLSFDLRVRSLLYFGARLSTVIRAQKNPAPKNHSRGEDQDSRGATLITVPKKPGQHLCRTPGRGCVRPEVPGSDNGAHSVGHYLLSLSLRSSRVHSVAVVISGFHLAPTLYGPYRNLLVPINASMKFDLYSRLSPEEGMSQFCDEPGECRNKQIQNIRILCQGDKK